MHCWKKAGSTLLCQKVHIFLGIATDADSVAGWREGGGGGGDEVEDEKYSRTRKTLPANTKRVNIVLVEVAFDFITAGRPRDDFSFLLSYLLSFDTVAGGNFPPSLNLKRASIHLFKFKQCAYVHVHVHVLV